jgi:hypothetical protein
MRRALGILLILAGPAVVAVRYLTAPSPATCALANKISIDLGRPGFLLHFAVGPVLRCRCRPAGRGNPAYPGAAAGNRQNVTRLYL